MSVSVTRIDGQNVGLRLLGQTSVQVMTLNLTTGDVDSQYLTTQDLQTLRQFAQRLLATVPVSARSAASIGLLSRLCAVSPADASTVTLASRRRQALHSSATLPTQPRCLASASSRR